MNRRFFFAALLAPFVSRFVPAPKPALDVFSYVDAKMRRATQELSRQIADDFYRTGLRVKSRQVGATQATLTLLGTAGWDCKGDGSGGYACRPLPVANFTSIHATVSPVFTFRSVCSPRGPSTNRKSRVFSANPSPVLMLK